MEAHKRAKKAIKETLSQIFWERVKTPLGF
jgi:hypothetical protein